MQVLLEIYNDQVHKYIIVPIKYKTIINVPQNNPIPLLFSYTNLLNYLIISPQVPSAYLLFNNISNNKNKTNIIKYKST